MSTWLSSTDGTGDVISGHAIADHSTRPTMHSSPTTTFRQATVREMTMSQWEYQKLDLNNVPTRSDDINLLNDVGKAGWEVIAITANNIVYLKRAVLPPKRPSTRRS